MSAPSMGETLMLFMMMTMIYNISRCRHPSERTSTTFALQTSKRANQYYIRAADIQASELVNRPIRWAAIVGKEMKGKEMTAFYADNLVYISGKRGKQLFVSEKALEMASKWETNKRNEPLIAKAVQMASKWETSKGNNDVCEEKEVLSEEEDDEDDAKHNPKQLLVVSQISKTQLIYEPSNKHASKPSKVIEYTDEEAVSYRAQVVFDDHSNNGQLSLQKGPTIVYCYPPSIHSDKIQIIT
eukprot:659916_1